jgi:hypothetical protein
MIVGRRGLRSLVARAKIISVCLIIDKGFVSSNSLVAQDENQQTSHRAANLSVHLVQANYVPIFPSDFAVYRLPFTYRHRLGPVSTPQCIQTLQLVMEGINFQPASPQPGQPGRDIL